MINHSKHVECAWVYGLQCIVNAALVFRVCTSCPATHCSRLLQVLLALSVKGTWNSKLEKMGR